jgi:hypothetical protein
MNITYYVITIEGRQREILRTEFLELLCSGEYRLIEERNERGHLIPGSARILVPKGNPALDEVYRLHHNETERERNRFCAF